MRLSSSRSYSESNNTMATNIPHLAISMQLESSAREIQETFEHLESTSVHIGDGLLQESTSLALHLCKRKVLKPYFRLISMLGWRPIVYPIAPQVTWYAKLFNLFYTILVIICILTGYVFQFASCLRLDGYPAYIINTTDDKVVIQSFYKHSTTHPLFQRISQNNTNSSDDSPQMSDKYDDFVQQSKDLKCSGNFISLYLVPDLLHLFAYLFVLQLMRTPECECLQNLLERVFLQATRISDWSVAHKKLVTTLRTFLWLCLTWVSISLLRHTLHIIVFQQISFTWIQPNSNLLYKIMIGFTLLSLTWNDIVCAAIVTTYSVHCQLNISYITNLVSSVREKRIDFQEFSKRAEESRKFIDYLNTDQALGVSLLIANFGCRAFVALFGLLSQQILLTNEVKTTVIVLTSSVLWLSLLSVPVVQAVRLTNSCQNLRRIGHVLRSRPFGYQDTPQEDLDSLLIYTSNIKLEAKMLSIPIRAPGVLTILIIIIFMILFLGQINVVKF